MSVPELKSEEEFTQFVTDSGLSVVHFYASWAPSCDQLNVLLEDLLADLPGSRAAFVDAEAQPAVSLKHNITAAPTVLFFKAGQEVDRVNGFHPADIRQKMSQHQVIGSSAATSAAPVEETKEDLNTRLKKLINSHRIMLFMKGVPDQPRCGFSRQVIELLRGVDSEFGTFDILEDDEVRQGLKTYSNWPTFPQLYLNGELIGGLDVLKEELQDPDFVASLPKKEKHDLDSRLKKLVSSHQLMLFMKGNPGQPRCGFSRTTVELLNGINADYGTFDILEDAEVRQGLKTFSNWPTFPQIYLKGELLGGLDVFREELEDPDFVAALPKKA